MAYSKIERSYHSSKVIREYQDRGMMKWQGFYLSEHTSAMKLWGEGEKLPEIKNQLSKVDIIQLLTQSMLNRVKIKISLKPGRSQDQKEGIVKELFSLNEFFFEVALSQFVRINISKIITVAAIV